MVHDAAQGTITVAQQMEFHLGRVAQQGYLFEQVGPFLTTQGPQDQHPQGLTRYMCLPWYWVILSVRVICHDGFARELALVTIESAKALIEITAGIDDPLSPGEQRQHSVSPLLARDSNLRRLSAYFIPLLALITDKLPIAIRQGGIAIDHVIIMNRDIIWHSERAGQ